MDKQVKNYPEISTVKRASEGQSHFFFCFIATHEKVMQQGNPLFHLYCTKTHGYGFWLYPSRYPSNENKSPVGDGPLGNLSGVGRGDGRAKYKKILAQGRIKWKKFIHANQPKKIVMLQPKTNSYKEFDNEKNSCGSKIPHPVSIIFLIVRP